MTREPVLGEQLEMRRGKHRWPVTVIGPVLDASHGRGPRWPRCLVRRAAVGGERAFDTFADLDELHARQGSLW